MDVLDGRSFVSGIQTVIQQPRSGEELLLGEPPPAPGAQPVQGEADEKRHRRDDGRCGRQRCSRQRRQQLGGGAALRLRLVPSRRTVILAVAPERGADAGVQLGALVRAFEVGLVGTGVDRDLELLQQRRPRPGDLQPAEGGDAGLAAHPLDEEVRRPLVDHGEALAPPLLAEDVDGKGSGSGLGRTNRADQLGGPAGVDEDAVGGGAAGGLLQARLQRQERAPAQQEEAAIVARLHQPRHPRAEHLAAVDRGRVELDVTLEKERVNWTVPKENKNTQINNNRSDAPP
jgi:hypothetical protein